MAVALALLLIFVPFSSRADSGGANISEFSVERTAEGVFVSASINFVLPPSVDDALLKGVPMVFSIEAELLRDRWYWTDKKIVTAQRHVRLAYLPLTRRWRIAVLSGPQIGNTGVALGQSFDALDDALAHVQRLSHWRIADATDVEPGSRHNITLRFQLDVAQLPRLFQIGALGQSDWDISATAFARLPVEFEK